MTITGCPCAGRSPTSNRRLSTIPSTGARSSLRSRSTFRKSRRASACLTFCSACASSSTVVLDSSSRKHFFELQAENVKVCLRRIERGFGAIHCLRRRKFSLMNPLCALELGRAELQVQHGAVNIRARGVNLFGARAAYEFVKSRCYLRKSRFGLGETRRCPVGVLPAARAVGPC